MWSNKTYGKLRNEFLAHFNTSSFICYRKIEPLSATALSKLN